MKINDGPAAVTGDEDRTRSTARWKRVGRSGPENDPGVRRPACMSLTFPGKGMLKYQVWMKNGNPGNLIAWILCFLGGFMNPDMAITACPPFSEISDEDLKLCFAQSFRHTIIPPSTQVLNRNERVRHVGYICSGAVELLSAGDKDEEYRRYTLDSGDFFGIEVLFGRGLALFDGLTVERVECYVIERPRLFELLSDNPELRPHFERIFIKEMKRFICYPLAWSHQSSPPDEPTAEEHRFSESMAYIDAHYTEALSLAEVAAKAGLSRFYFSRMFKEETGHSFKDYLNMKRLEAAKKLLLLPEMNISQSCYSAGFNDVSYFARIFRRYEGVSPSEFCKQVLGSV